MVNKPLGDERHPLFKKVEMASSEDDTDIADQAYALGDKVDSFVDERPLTALAIAAVVGALLARHFFSSRAEDASDKSELLHDERSGDFLDNLRRRIA